MAEPEETSQDTGVLLNRITVESVLDADGDMALAVRYSPDLRISDALGMLEYAKVVVVRAYESGDED